MVEENEITTRDQLMPEMDRAWNDLQALVSAADDSALMDYTDPAGWSARDHLAHLAAWENGVLVMLRDGRPQWEGLGIDQSLLESDGYDDMNEVIRQQTVDWSLGQVMAHLAEVHTELTRVVEGLSPDDLQRPCSDYVAGGQDFAVIHKIDGNGPHHFDEHRVYIERILAGNM